MPLFEPLPPGHPGESRSYRSKFREAAALVCLYRVAGTGAAAVGLAGSAFDKVARSGVLLTLLCLYVVYSAAVIHYLASPRRVPGLRRSFGRGQRAILDGRVFPVVDVAVAVGVNLLFAYTLARGTVYEQYTDLFAVAMIGTSVLWAGRYGGRVGLGMLGITFITEVIKGPINGLTLSRVNWSIVSTRVSWSLCGVLVAVFGVRLLTQFADRDERLDEDQRILVEAAHSHDLAKQALNATHRILHSSSMTSSDKVEKAGEITSWVVVAMPGKHSPVDRRPGELADLIEGVVQQVRVLYPTVALEVVDAYHQPIKVEHADAWAALVRNLVLNGAQHSGGTQVTVRWRRSDTNLVMTVKDNGTGYQPESRAGTGLAIVRRAAAEIGGDISVSSTSGCRWELRVPAFFSASEEVT